MSRFLFALSFCFSGLIIFGQVQSPNEFLPHKIGESFTPHHLMVDYFQHVAESSDMVKLIEYGRTYEGRPLMLAFVSSPENIKNLESIKLNNRSIAGMSDGQANGADKAIVWLNFSIHGNESAGSESSHNVIFNLVDPSNKETKAWLENTVVIIDPACNPDGYSRYTNWQRSIAPVNLNTNYDDIEHHEPWPNGRTNHYYFDLNRDWAWQTQIESQQRVKVLSDWMPHILADLHEMGYNSSYYFAPAAKPMHKYINDWQREFQHTVGKNHAKYFDDEGWLYFTKEVFDLFYPSYGDTYPIFNGAIGMTYEQGGSGVGGRAIDTKNGEVLTIQDRVDHHTTTALSTIEVSSNNASALVNNFRKFFRDSSENPPGKYRSYIVKGTNTDDRVTALTEMLDKQQINYYEIDKQGNHKGFAYQTGRETNFSVAPGDLLIPANQARAVLTQVLFDPESQLEDSLTYDITAWALPYAYGLEAYATTQKLNARKAFDRKRKTTQQVDQAYAYVIEKNGTQTDRFIAQLLEQGVTIKTNSVDTKIGKTTFEAGSYVITRGDNRSIDDQLVGIINATLTVQPTSVQEITSGFVDQGFDLGSSEYVQLKNPKAICLSGEGVNPYDFGQVKFYFDQILAVPLTVVDVSRFSGINLSNYNTLIMPNGWYNISDDQLTKISDWVASGGKLIAMEGATNVFADKPGFALKHFVDENEKNEAESKNKALELAARYNHYSEKERNYISSYIPGAIIHTKLDQTHPLASGLGSHYFSLKTNSLAYPLMVDANNVGYLNNNPQIIGFVGKKAQEKIKDTVSFAVEDKGSGTVIYMVDNPLFRCFWYNGFRLFSNALFLVN